MLLRDATSEEQVAAALAAGDEELLDDIEDELKEAKRRWERDPVDYDADNGIDVEDQVTTDAFVDAVIHQSPTEYELANIPREAVVAAVTNMPERTYSRVKHFGPFYLNDHCKHFDFYVTASVSYYFPSHWAPDNAEFIPENLAKEFWEDLGYRLDWEHTSHVDGDNWAHGEGERLCITAAEDEFVEWCRDTIAEYMGTVVRKDPEKAKELFFALLANRNGKIAAALKEAKLPDDELLELAQQWFTDQDEAYEAIEEYVSAITATGEPNEIIAEWSKQDIADMGIRQGTLFENAPWKLIKLHASDLRGEGRMMNHCVGQSGMGYIDAVKRGETEIWSLRSRDNKPRFTLEVDSAFYDVGGRAEVPEEGDNWRVWRGEHIKQLKGKANRTPGFADVRRTGGIKFPDEVIFWNSALNQFGVDPGVVEDFSATHGGAVVTNGGEVCTGFDLPYRRGVRQNRRRSSKRRGSKRRTSRRKSSRM